MDAFHRMISNLNEALVDNQVVIMRISMVASALQANLFKCYHSRVEKNI